MTAQPLGLVDADAPSSGLSALEALRDDFASDMAAETLTLPVPGRPGYAVRFGTSIAYEQLAAWRKRAVDKGVLEGINTLRLACILLAAKCEAILKDGEELLEGGTPVTFTSPALHEMLGVVTAADAVRKFYGRDPHVSKAANRVMSAAGYADDDPEVDPTDL